MDYLSYSYIGIDLAHYEIVRAKVGQGGTVTRSLGGIS